ncbi:uncharacterized protein A4U43_C03F29890 [Asparagus officinalis]|uniref:Uncharacterized protein n=1 Tax=Asparagus officinalis TaxID=4686 RepID=A0A5P1FJ42_ASPOF|nr:uncharacterized protein A4U43_C03F29890 [Asparagus officinalis]
MEFTLSRLFPSSSSSLTSTLCSSLADMNLSLSKILNTSLIAASTSTPPSGLPACQCPCCPYLPPCTTERASPPRRPGWEGLEGVKASKPSGCSLRKRVGRREEWRQMVGCDRTDGGRDVGGGSGELGGRIPLAACLGRN